jgi:hypothetical protein
MSSVTANDARLAGDERRLGHLAAVPASEKLCTSESVVFDECAAVADWGYELGSIPRQYLPTYLESDSQDGGIEFPRCSACTQYLLIAYVENLGCLLSDEATVH